MKKACKSALGILLAAAMLLSLALFAGAGKADNTLKIAVASDVHYNPLSALPPIEDCDYLPGDPLFRHVNTKGMLTYEADAVIAEFLRQTEASGAEFLLVPGDLSEEGHWAEHLGIAEKLREFQNRTGIKVFVTPGNHDIRTSASRGRLDPSDFAEVYHDMGFDQALVRDDLTLSYTAELSAGYRLLAIDTCVYREDESRVSEELLAWIGAQLLAAQKDGKKVIAMTHYNVLDHFWLEGFTGKLLCADQYRTLANLLADAGVRTVYTGHVHANDIAYAVTAQGNKIYDVETCSLITYPNAWREVTYSDASIKIETRLVEKIDPSLLPAGFSRAQTDAITSDFQKYSLGYFRAGFRSYAGMIADLTGTLAESLGAEEGAAGYEAIEAAVAALQGAVNLPIYGAAGSVEALAKKANVTLERSDYVNLLDLAGAIYAGHYAGNERYPMESREVRLLGQALNAVLVTALTDVPVRALNALLAGAGLPELVPPLNGLLNVTTRRIYARTAAKAVTNELVRTLAGGVFTDWSGVDDLNCTLEPYGGEPRSQPGGRAAKITDLTFYLDVAWRVAEMVMRMVVRIVGM